MSAADAAPAVSLGEAQAFARVETGEEEALLAGLVRTASQYCEAFTGQVLVRRSFVLEMGASGEWQRLELTPVRSIGAIEAVAIDGGVTTLTPEFYAVDIDGRGDGWVRVTGVTGRIRVHGEAGMAEDCNGVPEPLRQGILRLTAHLYATRDGIGGEPPAAVAALWRPFRRMRLA